MTQISEIGKHPDEVVAYSYEANFFYSAECLEEQCSRKYDLAGSTIVRLTHPGQQHTRYYAYTTRILG